MPPPAEVSAALGAAVPREPVAPVAAGRLVLAHLPVPAPLPQEPELPALVPLVLAGLPVLAHLVVVPAAAVPRHPLSRQSFSAARARSSPSPGPPTYEPVPR